MPLGTCQDFSFGALTFNFTQNSTPANEKCVKLNWFILFQDINCVSFSTVLVACTSNGKNRCVPIVPCVGYGRR